MNPPPFLTMSAELRALQNKEVQLSSQIQMMKSMRGKARVVDKLRIMRGQCSEYIGKAMALCDNIEG